MFLYLFTNRAVVYVQAHYPNIAVLLVHILRKPIIALKAKVSNINP